MDYSEIVEELQKASLFDLHRLQVAINRLLENPDRIEEIKRQLRPGQEITYFDATENREIEAIVVKLKRTRVLVEHKRDQQRWNIPLYYVNLERVDTEIKVPSGKVGLDKSQLKVGDRVGFRDKQNNDLYGEVIRLNPKTATIRLEDNTQWRVSYKLLYSVIEGEQMGRPRLIEGEVLEGK